MNIVVLSDFSPASQQVIRDASSGATVHFYRAMPIDQLPADVLSSAEVFYTNAPLPDPEKAPRLKWVQAHSAGVDQLVGHPLFKSRGNGSTNGVILTTASGVHAINISEYIVMMMLALGHRLPQAFKMKQHGEWDVNRPQYVPAELHGATLGLIGYGAIGKRTAQAGASLGMRVMVLRHHANVESVADGITFYRRERLTEMLGVCDYVALTAPLTPSTYHMIDSAAFAAMKQTACLINIARGDLVDEQAMIDALNHGVIMGAALDVFAQEPLPIDSPLWRMDNVIMTPHIAGQTPNYERRAAELFASNLRRYISGEPLMNQVDFARGY